MGLGDEALHRDGGARRRGGGRARPGRARRTARLDGPAPARSRLRPAVRRPAADLQARQAADLLEHRHRGARHLSRRRRRRCPSPTTSRAAVLEPLGLSGTALEGRPPPGSWARSRTCSHSAGSSWPRPLSRPETLQEATTVAFPGLDGILPDFGRYEPLDWGLGFEIRDAKVPHWTGTSNSPRTFGHFGGAGSFIWVDPEAGRCLRRACGPAVRPVGEGGLAAALRRRSRGATMTGSRVEPPDHRRLLHVRGAVSSLPRRLQLGR